MKKILLCTFLFNLATHSFAADILDKVESPIFQKPGTPEQLIARAKVCIAETVKSDAGGNTATANPITIATEDKIIANSRFEYTHRLLRHSAKSKIILEAREGRFKITHTEIGYKQVATTGVLAWGASRNDSEGHIQLAKVWGTGWEELERQLQDLSKKIADCVISDKKQDW